MSVYTKVLTTDYGTILVNPHDIHQYPPLEKCGKALDHEDIRFLCYITRLCGDGVVITDIGANYGLYSVALGTQASQQNGTVISIEAQRILYYMVAGNVALNSLTNVHCYHVAIGDHRGRLAIPQYDYFNSGSFGSVEFGSDSSDVLQQRLPNDPNEMVEMVTLDSFNLDRVDLIKLDIEGMEYQALLGGKSLIERCKPTLWVEWMKSDRQQLCSFLTQAGYTIYEHGWDWLCIQPDKLTQLQQQISCWNIITL